MSANKLAEVTLPNGVPIVISWSIEQAHGEINLYLAWTTADGVVPRKRDAVMFDLNGYFKPVAGESGAFHRVAAKSGAEGEQNG